SRTIPSLRRAPHPRPLYPPPTRRSSDLTATATQRPDQGDQSTAVTKGPAIAPALFFCQSVRLPWRRCTRLAIRKSNIYLIGPMGAGKTAVGRELAKALGRPFFDSDAEIEKRTGVDIPFIFEKEGERGFRERERECLAELTSRENVVVATGGGG